jgi:arginine:ornithine antiporter/lysine permease
MLATVFVFLGVEGATVYSRHARRREDVGKATVTGFLGVLALFAAVSILSFGVLARPDIADLQQPSMAGVLESVVGHWGKGFVSIGLVISVLGAYLAWTMMAAEVLYVAAKDWDMPRFLSRTNRFDAPQVATLATTILIQIVLVVTYFSDDAFTFTLELCSALSLIPYMLAAAYALKLGVTRETYEHDAKARNRQALVAGLATFYTVFLLYAAGTKFLLLSCVIYAPGTILFVMARREKRQRLFSPAEAAIFAAVTLGAIVGVVGLAVGYISI